MNRLWTRLGDGGEYEDWGADLAAVAGVLLEVGIEPHEMRQIQGGLSCPIIDTLPLCTSICLRPTPFGTAPRKSRLREGRTVERVVLYWYATEDVGIRVPWIMRRCWL